MRAVHSWAQTILFYVNQSGGDFMRGSIATIIILTLSCMQVQAQDIEKLRDISLSVCEADKLFQGARDCVCTADKIVTYEPLFASVMQMIPGDDNSEHRHMILEQGFPFITKEFFAKECIDTEKLVAYMHADCEASKPDERSARLADCSCAAQKYVDWMESEFDDAGVMNMTRNDHSDARSKAFVQCS